MRCSTDGLRSDTSRAGRSPSFSESRGASSRWCPRSFFPSRSQFNAKCVAIRNSQVVNFAVGSYVSRERYTRRNTSCESSSETAMSCTIRYTKWMTGLRCFSSRTPKLRSSPSRTRSINWASGSSAGTVLPIVLTPCTINSFGRQSLAPQSPAHQPLDRLTRRSAQVQNRVHFRSYRQINTVARRKLQRDRCSCYAFRHHGRRIQYAAQFQTRGQLEPYLPVAAEVSRAGEYEIAQTCQARQGFGIRAHRDRQPRQLGQAPRNQSRHGIVAKAEPVADASPDGDHILERAADLHAYGIGAAVNAERRPGEARLDFPHQTIVLGRGHESGGVSRRRFRREGGPGKDGDPVSRPHDRAYNLRDPQERSRFEAFACTHDPHRRLQPGNHSGIHITHGMRRHHAQNHLGIDERRLERMPGAHVGRQRDAGEKDVVLARPVASLGEIGLVNLERNAIEVGSEHAGQRRAPAAAANDREPRHPTVRWKEKTRSSPARMRAMLPRCRSTITTAAPIADSSTGQRGCRIIQQAKGNRPAAITDPSER